MVPGGLAAVYESHYIWLSPQSIAVYKSTFTLVKGNQETYCKDGIIIISCEDYKVCALYDVCIRYSLKGIIL